MVEVNRILDKTYNLTLTWDVFKLKPYATYTENEVDLTLTWDVFKYQQQKLLQLLPKHLTWDVFKSSKFIS